MEMKFLRRDRIRNEIIRRNLEVDSMTEKIEDQQKIEVVWTFDQDA